MSRGWEGCGGRGHTAAFTYTIFLSPPFPKPAVSFLSLWPKLCSNMKMGSDKGVCGAGTWEIQEISYFNLKIFFGSNATLSCPTSPGPQESPVSWLRLPWPGEPLVLSSRSTDAWGAFGQHLLQSNPPAVWGGRDKKEAGVGERREKR